jgi:hypothetical protein
VATAVSPDVGREIVVHGHREAGGIVAVDGDIEAESAKIRYDQMLVVIVAEPADVSHDALAG